LPISGERTASVRICDEPTLSRGIAVTAVAVPPSATKRATLAATLA
jgi:hypothetical protein